MKIKIISLLSIFLILMGVSCSKKEEAGKETGHKLIIMTSLYPIYDFVKNVGKDKVDVELLLPPGVEPHSFEPKPEDIVRLNRSDIFIYTNKYMEPWVDDIIKGLDSKKTTIVDSSKGIVFLEEAEELHQETSHDDHGHAGMDPHIWLDLGDAIKMVDNIRDALISRDPSNEPYYRKNAGEYDEILRGLDAKFRQGLSQCRKRIFINGGHFAFGYLARRYGLNYISAYGFSPDAEPTPGQMIKITQMLKENGLKYIFYEELISPRTAETLARETGAKMLFLHGIHNISREDFAKGLSFVSLMERNLENLEIGLECS